MKRMQTIIWAVMGAVAILAILAVAVYVKKAGQKIEPKAGDEGSAIVGSPNEAMEKFRKIAEEDRANMVEEKSERGGRWANMSEEEKEKFRELLRKRDNAIKQSEKRGVSQISEDEKTALMEKWANMSEQEREEFRAKLRERIGAAQQEPNVVSIEPNVVGQEPNAVGHEK